MKLVGTEDSGPIERAKAELERSWATPTPTLRSRRPRVGGTSFIRRRLGPSAPRSTGCNPATELLGACCRPGSDQGEP